MTTRSDRVQRIADLVSGITDNLLLIERAKEEINQALSTISQETLELGRDTVEVEVLKSNNRELNQSLLRQVKIIDSLREELEIVKAEKILVQRERDAQHVVVDINVSTPVAGVNVNGKKT